MPNSSSSPFVPGCPKDPSPFLSGSVTLLPNFKEGARCGMMLALNALPPPTLSIKMVSILRRRSKAKGKSATNPSHASKSGTTVSLNLVEDVPQVVSLRDEQFQLSPPIALSITLSNSEDVTLPTTDSTSTKVKRGRTQGKGLSKMNKSFGKKLKVHVDLDKGRPVNRVQSTKLSSQLGVISREFIRIPIKWKDMEVHNFNLTLDNLDVSVFIIYCFLLGTIILFSFT
ncbi:hypothetical protein Pint_26733 [Pistacia integerrima]|uniref:Uncharacterized protein n=1 Tax=Pistacia integerrima TaxID=434235 RepID=A0ACC0YU57_9ROSI|nr:hypothetical protein Pint_26733 [Pistacia integerrima]